MDVPMYLTRGDVPAASLVFVVDDDASVRIAICGLLETVGIAVEQFAGAVALLERLCAHGQIASGCPNCLILDIRMPGLGGLELQNRLAALNVRAPVVFVSAFGDVSITVQAMKNGAQDVIVKPFRDQQLLDAVNGALRVDSVRRDESRHLADLRARYELLSDRERSVLALIAKGLMNKQVAGKLNLSEITVKVHRAHIMRKMNAKTFADLVRMEERLREGAGLPM